MHQIQKLEIIGFKSFCDRTSVVFNEGCTAIVGPNGCGKSNIADAIRWVLGEQSPKQLRGEKMEDLIFSGSEGRHHQVPAGGHTVDNAEGPGLTLGPGGVACESRQDIGQGQQQNPEPGKAWGSPGLGLARGLYIRLGRTGLNHGGYLWRQA